MPISIYIKKDTSNASAESSLANNIPGGSTSAPATNERVELGLNKQAVNSALIQAGEQAIAKGLNQFTNITGNDALSRKISDVTSLSADALTILKGGVLGAGVVAMKHIGTALVSQIQTEQANYEIEKQREKLGVISLKGSRY